MNKRLKAFLPAIAVVALLAYNPAAAQDDAADGTATEAAASADDDGSAFDEFAAENSEPATVTVSTTPPPAKSAAPVAPATVREPRGASEGLWYSLGWRWGIGLSSFNNHAIIGPPEARAAVGPGVNATLGLSGAATSLMHVPAIKTDLSVTVDVQLSTYTGYAKGRSKIYKSSDYVTIPSEIEVPTYELTVPIPCVSGAGCVDGRKDTTFIIQMDNVQTGVDVDVEQSVPNRGIAGLLSVEIPVLVRFDNLLGRAAGPLYIEAGPQFGWNAYARYALSVEGVRMPYRHGFMFGPALGAGANFGDWAVGLRAFYDALPYSKLYGGHPWTLQAGMTKYFWDY